MKKKHWDWLEKEINKLEDKEKLCRYFLTKPSYEGDKEFKFSSFSIDSWIYNISKIENIEFKCFKKHNKKFEKIQSQLIRDVGKPDFVLKIPFWINRLNSVCLSSNGSISNEFAKFIKAMFIHCLFFNFRYVNHTSVNMNKMTYRAIDFVEEQIEFIRKLKTIINNGQ